MLASASLLHSLVGNNTPSVPERLGVCGVVPLASPSAASAIGFDPVPLITMSVPVPTIRSLLFSDDADTPGMFAALMSLITVNKSPPLVVTLVPLMFITWLATTNGFSLVPITSAGIEVGTLAVPSVNSMFVFTLLISSAPPSSVALIPAIPALFTSATISAIVLPDSETVSPLIWKFSVVTFGLVTLPDTYAFVLLYCATCSVVKPIPSSALLSATASPHGTYSYVRDSSPSSFRTDLVAKLSDQ